MLTTECSTRRKPSCRDKGWGGVDEGALCLSSLGCGLCAPRSPQGIALPPGQAQGPTHLRIRPLSLQNAGDASVPMGVITLFDWKNSSGYDRSCWLQFIIGLVAGRQ